MRRTPGALAPACRHQAAYSRIALLLAVAALGIVLTGLWQYWQTENTRKKEEALLNIGQQFRQALLGYATAMPSDAPAGPLILEELVHDSRFSPARQHLPEIFQDPMTGRAEWGVVRAGGRIIAVYSLAPGRPLKREGFSDPSFNEAESYANWRFAPDLPAAPAPRAKPATPAPAAMLLDRSAMPEAAGELKKEDACAAEMLGAHAGCPADKEARAACRKKAQARFAICVLEK